MRPTRARVEREGIRRPLGPGGGIIDRTFLHKREGGPTTPALFNGKANKIIMLAGSGLYKLIMRSNKPEAKTFRDW